MKHLLPSLYYILIPLHTVLSTQTGDYQGRYGDLAQRNRLDLRAPKEDAYAMECSHNAIVGFIPALRRACLGQPALQDKYRGHADKQKSPHEFLNNNNKLHRPKTRTTPKPPWIRHQPRRDTERTVWKRQEQKVRNGVNPKPGRYQPSKRRVWSGRDQPRPRPTLISLQTTPTPQAIPRQYTRYRPTRFWRTTTPHPQPAGPTKINYRNNVNIDSGERKHEKFELTTSENKHFRRPPRTNDIQPDAKDALMPKPSLPPYRMEGHEERERKLKQHEYSKRKQYPGHANRIAMLRRQQQHRHRIGDEDYPVSGRSWYPRHPASDEFSQRAMPNKITYNPSQHSDFIPLDVDNLAMSKKNVQKKNRLSGSRHNRAPSREGNGGVQPNIGSYTLNRGDARNVKHYSQKLHHDMRTMQNGGAHRPTHHMPSSPRNNDLPNFTRVRRNKLQNRRDQPRFRKQQRMLPTPPWLQQPGVVGRPDTDTIDFGDLYLPPVRQPPPPTDRRPKPQPKREEKKKEVIDDSINFQMSKTKGVAAFANLLQMPYENSENEYYRIVEPFGVQMKDIMSQFRAEVNEG